MLRSRRLRVDATRLALAAQLPRSLLKKKPALWWGTSVTKAWQR